jgi:membrane-associated protease RseP (regulator of RpoE activity)
MVTFQSLSDWGGTVGFVVTAVGMAQRGLPSWCTAIGVLFVGHGIANALPLPPFTGFHMFHALYRVAFGKPLPAKLTFRLTLVGILFWLVILCRFLYIDVCWMITTWW